MKARYYSIDDGGVRCGLCPHRCLIPEGMAGRCLARANRDGSLVAEGYGQVTSMALDPVEKKPLYYFHPGRHILSVGSYGCNMSCPFCQNHDISQERARAKYVSPIELADAAAESAVSGDNIGVAFTYNEPLISAEYILDAAPLLKERGMNVVLVTNGYANPEVISDLLPWVDAVNIDLKAFADEFYKRCGGSLEPVKYSIEAFAACCHVELTTLIVPGWNDDPDMMAAQADWIASVSPDIPLHLSRFFPRYRMAGADPTAISSLKKLEAIAKDRLRYVSLGNV